jgi:hypothetical protein
LRQQGQHLLRRRGDDPGRLHDQPGADVDQAGADHQAADAGDAAEHQVADLRQLADFAPAALVVGQVARFQLQLRGDLAELLALDEVVTALEGGQQLLGQGAAGVGEADVAADLEVGDAEAVAALLQGEGAVVDLLADLEGVPGLLRLLEGGDGVLEVGRVAAQLGGVLAVVVVPGEGTAEVVEPAAQVGVVAVGEGLFVGDGGGAEVAVLAGGVAATASACRFSRASWSATSLPPYSWRPVVARPAAASALPSLRTVWMSATVRSAAACCSASLLAFSISILTCSVSWAARAASRTVRASAYLWSARRLRASSKAPSYFSCGPGSGGATGVTGGVASGVGGGSAGGAGPAGGVAWATCVPGATAGRAPSGLGELTTVTLTAWGSTLVQPAGNSPATRVTTRPRGHRRRMKASP